MTGADVVLAVLAVGVAILLARHSRPLVAAPLVVSALAISAVLFLPTPILTTWLGMGRVYWLYDMTWATPLRPPEWIHLLAFAWLGMLFWLARREARNWRGLALIATLGLAAELSQWLTDGRTPKLEDAALNTLGGLTGAALGHLCTAIAGRWRRRSARAHG